MLTPAGLQVPFPNAKVFTGTGLLRYRVNWQIHQQAPWFCQHGCRHRDFPAAAPTQMPVRQ